MGKTIPLVSECSLSYHRLVPTRARPLPPDERRAALVAATLPLVVQHGPSVTTRQIADAAGVAEGTIFGVFPDKETLIRATVAAAFDPASVVDRLASLDPSGTFEDRLTAAVVILQERLAKVFNLITAFRLHEPPDEHVHVNPPANVAIVEALAELFAHDAERLRLEPAQCARLLRLVVFAGSHPRITDDNPLSAEEIVDLLLHGIAHDDADVPPAPIHHRTTGV
jgi:AcrR family transcriptional regulator